MVALGQNMLSSAKILLKIAQTTPQLHQRLQCRVLAVSKSCASQMKLEHLLEEEPACCHTTLY